MVFRSAISGMFFVCAMLLSLASARADSETRAETSRPLQSIVLQLKWSHAFQFAGYYAAKELGYYEEIGLDVDIQESGPGRNSVEEVVAGRAQYGIADSSIVLERANGKPVVVLGVVFQHSAIVLLAQKTGAEQTVHDLAGKRIMLVPGDAELRAYLQKTGLSSDLYTEIENSFNIRDFIDKKTDAFSAYITDQPYVLNHEKIPYVSYTARSVGIDFYGDNLFTTEDEIEKNRERAKAFRDASFRGWEYAMKHQAEIIDLILSKYSPDLDKGRLEFEAKKMESLIQPVLIELGYMHKGRWRHIVETYIELGIVSKTFSLEGFIYEEKSENDLRWFYRGLAATLLGLLIIAFVAFRFYRLSKALKIDIRARQRAEKEKEALESQLLHAQKMQAIGTLAGGMAHDMNNVLAVILGLGSVLEDEMEPDEPLLEDVVDIVTAAKRGQSMVANLLGFARKGSYVETLWSPSDGIEQMTTLLEKMISKSIVITTELSAVSHVLCDANQMIAALMNLCVNAAQSISSNGRISIRTHDIDISTEEFNSAFECALGPYIKIEVQDDGKGMDEETRNRAFDPFFTTKDIGEGTGLGLSMVHGVVENHGGVVTIDSVLGEGTTISIHLPATTSESSEEEIVEEQSETIASGKILVIDDEALIRKTLFRMLSSVGYEVVTADSGEMGLELFRDSYSDIDLVLLDLTMPVMNGAEIFSQLQTIDPSARVFICTGEGDPADTATMVEHGAVGVLLKPFALADLRESIANVLGQN